MTRSSWVPWLAAALLAAPGPGSAARAAGPPPSAAPPSAVAAADAAVRELAAQARRAKPAPRLDLERFLAEAALRQVELSPAGDRIADLGRDAGGAWIGIVDLERGARRQVALAAGVDRLAWSADGRGLLLVAGDRLGYLPAAGGRPSYFARLDADRGLEVDGADPVVPGALLVREETKVGEHRLLRWRRDGGEEVLLESERPIAAVTFDRDGRPAFVQQPEGAEMVLYRLGESGLDGAREVLRCTIRDACNLLAAAADGGTVFLRSRIGRDRWALAAFDVASGRLETLHRDPLGRADLDAVQLDPASGAPLLATYDTERRRNYAVDPALAGDLRRIEAVLAGRDSEVETMQVEARRAGRFWLVRGEGARLQHPRYFAWDRRRRELTPVLAAERARVTGLPQDALAERRHFDYRAGDGRLVHGFLTLPRGLEPAGLPLVVLVHGGPWNHERSGYRTVPQFLANRGYAVFEPNFRGSTGYGLDYLRAARGEFGDGRVHRDLVDGVHHLLELGIGDRHRVAVAGHSFGGFSALGAVIFSPELFRAAVASAPPIDLVRAARDLDEEGGIGGMPVKPLLRDVLVDLDDPAAVAALQRRSPEANLARTARPLLVLAGGRDEKVQLADVEHYVAALDELGKDVSLLVDPRSGHSLERDVQRRALLFLLERFLGHQLGVASPSRPDPLLAAYLRRNLRLTGPSLAAALGADAAPLSAAATTSAPRPAR